MNKKIDLIFIKDPHLLLGFQIPSNRQDTFFEEIQKKWDFILDYCNKNQINNVIITGDLFDKNQISQWNFQSFLKNKNFLKNIKNKLGKPLISIRGNHDEFNGKSTNEDTIFGTLVELDLIEYIGNENKNKNYKEFYLENKNIKLYGFDFENEDKKLYDNIKKYNFNADFNIAMLHSAVVDVETKKEKFSCVGYDYLINNNNKVDMWVLGHYHKGYDTKLYKNKYFINSWNLTRLTRDDYVLDNKHKPEFVHVTFTIKNDNLSVNTKNIKVPCLPYEKSFLDNTKTMNEMMIDEFNFFTKLDEETSENFDEFLKLEELKKNNKINSNVYKIIKNNLQ